MLIQHGCQTVYSGMRTLHPDLRPDRATEAWVRALRTDIAETVTVRCRLITPMYGGGVRPSEVDTDNTGKGKCGTRSTEFLVASLARSRFATPRRILIAMLVVGWHPQVRVACKPSDTSR